MYYEDFTTVNLNPYEISSQIIAKDSSDLVYSVITKPDVGDVTIIDGIITYTPNTLQQSIERMVVKVENITNNSHVNLVYDINQVVVPRVSKTISHDGSVNLFDTIEVKVLFENTSDFTIENVTLLPNLSPGLNLLEAYYLDENNQEVIMTRTVNNFEIGDLNAKSSYTINLVYKSCAIPTDLIYCVGSYASFEMGGVFFEDTHGSNLKAPYIFDVVADVDGVLLKNSSYSAQIPIIEPSYSYLSYKIKTQGMLGKASVDSSNFSYTPNLDAVGVDKVVVEITNTQLNRTLDLTYSLTILDDEKPFDISIGVKLLDFLNNHVYLLGLNKISPVYFNCDIWNEGYIKNNVVVIPSVKETYASLLDELSDRVNELFENLYTTPSDSNSGFKAQIMRFLGVIGDIKHKVLSLNCVNNCDTQILGYFLSVISRSINALIKTYTTLESLVVLQGSVCTNHFDYMIGDFVNGVTKLYDISVSFNPLFNYFILSSSSSVKGYVPSYIPKF